MKLYSSTPPFCDMCSMCERADSLQTDYCSKEWDGAWKTLTCGPTIDASALHKHHWEEIGACLVMTANVSDVIPEITTMDIGRVACPWDVIVGCCLIAKNEFHLWNGYGAGCILVSDASGRGTWQTPAAGGLWSDTSGQIQPSDSGCDIVPNGTACVGQAADLWTKGYFATVVAPNIETSCICIAPGAANGCFACSNADGKIIWTTPPSESKWQNTGTSIQTCTANCNVIPHTGGTLGTSGCFWQGLYSAFAHLCTPGTGASSAAIIQNCNIGYKTMAICAGNMAWSALEVFGISLFCGHTINYNNDASTFTTHITNGGDASRCTLYVHGSIHTGNNYAYFPAGCLDMTGGDKAATIEYERGKYAVLKVDESPDVVFNDHGTVFMVPKIPCCVKFDCIFNKVTEKGNDYNLQLTPLNSNDKWKIEKKQDGFIIENIKANNFDWHVRKIRKGFKYGRWLKDNKPFNPNTFKPDAMNTFEKYPVEQDVWSKQR